MEELEHVATGTDPVAYLIKKATENGDDAAGVLNVSEIKRVYETWHKYMPSVQPFFAVKCINHEMICRELVKYGCGFDCASVPEMVSAIKGGANTENIIFANTNKWAQAVRDSFANGVDMFTFDSEMELRRMLDNTPEGKKGRFVIRILPPRKAKAIHVFGAKFGTNFEETKRLIRLAKELGAEIIGFSFHVGSGNGDVLAYDAAIEFVGQAAEYAKTLGFNPFLIDIGGGFISQKGIRHQEDAMQELGIVPPTFEEVSKHVEAAIVKVSPHFKDSKPRCIAEPGRFFANDLITVGMKVITRHIVFENEDDPKFSELTTEQELIAAGCKVKEVKYVCSDGLFGYFNNMVLDHVKPYFQFYRQDGSKIPYEKVTARTNMAFHVSSIFGQSCHSADCVMHDQRLPLLDVGTWIMVEAYGSYSTASASTFGGFENMPVYPMVED